MPEAGKASRHTVGSGCVERAAEEAEGEVVRRGRVCAGHAVGALAGDMTAPGPRSGAVSGNPAAPARVSRETARRVVPLFRPYRAQVAAVVALIVVTSTIGVVNPLLIQAVFNKALFIPDGPNIPLLVTLVSIMAVIPIVNGAIGILQVYETTKVGQLVMRDLARPAV